MKLRITACYISPNSTDSNKVCLGTRVHPCCPADFSKGNPISSNKVNVAGDDVTVTYYLAQDTNESKSYTNSYNILTASAILHYSEISSSIKGILDYNYNASSALYHSGLHKIFYKKFILRPCSVHAEA